MPDDPGAPVATPELEQAEPAPPSAPESPTRDPAEAIAIAPPAMDAAPPPAASSADPEPPEPPALSQTVSGAAQLSLRTPPESVSPDLSMAALSGGAAPSLSIHAPAEDDRSPSLSIKVPADEEAPAAAAGEGSPSLSIRVPAGDDRSPSLSIRVPSDEDAEPARSREPEASVEPGASTPEEHGRTEGQVVLGAPAEAEKSVASTGAAPEQSAEPAGSGASAVNEEDIESDAGAEDGDDDDDEPGTSADAEDESKLVLKSLVELAGPATLEGEQPSSAASATETRVAPVRREGKAATPKRGIAVPLGVALVAGIAIAASVGLRQNAPANDAATRTVAPSDSAEHVVTPPPAPLPAESAATQAEVAVPEPPAGSTASSADPAQGSDFAAAFGAALDATATSTPVTVRVSPKGTVILDHGKRLGMDVVVVNVEPNAPRQLVAIQEGYAPARFTLDGKVRSVNIELKKNVPGAKQPPRPRKFDPAEDVAGL